MLVRVLGLPVWQGSPAGVRHFSSHLRPVVDLPGAVRARRPDPTGGGRGGVGGPAGGFLYRETERETRPIKAVLPARGPRPQARRAPRSTRPSGFRATLPEPGYGRFVPRYRVVELRSLSDSFLTRARASAFGRSAVGLLSRVLAALVIVEPARVAHQKPASSAPRALRQRPPLRERDPRLNVNGLPQRRLRRRRSRSARRRGRPEGRSPRPTSCRRASGRLASPPKGRRGRSSPGGRSRRTDRC